MRILLRPKPSSSAVPTPLTANREPDLGALIASARALAQVLQPGQLVVLESTTYPGTTRERLVPLLEESGLRVGEQLNVAFSPERVDPGRKDFTLRNTPKVVGGMTPECAERAEAVYGRICDHIVRVSTPEAAELTKLLENIFRAVNIALVNEMAVLSDRMGINIWEVVDAAATKPYGFMRFEPGPGMGGHCLPVDPFYLAWRAREFHMSTEFIELAGKINQQMPHYCVERIERALNDASKPVKGSRILMLGASYKGGWATFANRRPCASSRSWTNSARTSSTTTTTCPSCPNTTCVPAAGRRARRRRRRRDRHPPPRPGHRRHRHRRPVDHRLPRRHPRASPLRTSSACTPGAVVCAAAAEPSLDGGDRSHALSVADTHSVCDRCAALSPATNCRQSSASARLRSTLRHIRRGEWTRTSSLGHPTPTGGPCQISSM